VVEAKTVNLVKMTILRLVFDLLSMGSEENKVLKFQISVIVPKFHVGHANSPIYTANGNSIGLVPDSDRHNR
jgi:hypothetical protein